MLDSNDDIFLNHAGESMIVCRSDAQVELYYNNNKKLETTDGGIDITGTMMADGIQIQDTHKINLGNSQDLQIYHDSGDSFIVDQGTGGLVIQGSQTRIRNSSGHTQINASNDVVELYYDNSKKFETTSTGVQAGRYSFDSDNYITCNTSANTMEFVTNSTDIGEFSPSGLMLRDNMALKLGVGNDLRIFHDGSNSFIREIGTGGLRIRSDNTIDIETDSGTDIARFHPGGAVQLFNDGSMKFETTSNGSDLRGTLHRCEGHFRPYNNNTWDLGTSSDRWRNIYTNDLNLSNEGGANDVDGTCGSYTIQEGVEDLFLINNRSGKKYKFNLTEVA